VTASEGNAGSRPRTRVYLTVDVEGAEERRVGTAVRPAMGYDLRVWGRFDNRRQELGLAVLLQALARHRLAGTFFVEPFGSRFFGAEGLAQICGALRAAGQDVQLHAHPVQRTVDWHTRGMNSRPTDDMASFSVDEQAALLTEGAALLQAAGAGPYPLNAFRAGNFGANNDTWKAMARAGLVVSSNLNLCYLRKNCQISWPVPGNALFDTGEGVWELPVSNFREPSGGHRHLQITAISFAEMRAYLEQAHRLRIPEVTVVTHTFELFFIDSAGSRRGHANWINVRRWQQLCRYLDQNRDRFEVETVGALGQRLAARAPQAGNGALTTAPIPEGRAPLHLVRVLQQAMKRAAARIPI
jgi:hypothetical protein